MAATGTPTPNIGLRIPLGTDPASVDDINYNSNLIDTKLGAVGNDSVQDQIDDLNSKITTYRNWESISIANTNDSQSINSKYNEIYIEGTFSAGQKLLFHSSLGVANVRQDMGFYYNASTNGSGCVIFNDHRIVIYKPYYAGSETTFASVRAWGR